MLTKLAGDIKINYLMVQIDYSFLKKSNNIIQNQQVIGRYLDLTIP
ncbi:hypothetical protein SAMN04515674_112162 [Pseudarcicella hirudinis]|uniref:Uncharacterized protein n=1 Tax=Pseudarcicella hirudinis TaxID=1079859 RepID=A0A1I5WSZ1_9BACT|nr:hypothetical protein SAMN04515674_112162 [Pseudarcicella hirudinis]